MLVLIAEDDIITALALDQTVRAAGHQVLGPAATVTAALGLAEADLPDLAFVDVRLFHSDDGGYALAEALRELGVSCVFASGKPPDEMIGRGVGLGFITKPWTEQTITATLEFVAAVRQGATPPGVPEGLMLLERIAAPASARLLVDDARPSHGARAAASEL